MVVERPVIVDALLEGLAGYAWPVTLTLVGALMSLSYVTRLRFFNVALKPFRGSATAQRVHKALSILGVLMVVAGVFIGSWRFLVISGVGAPAEVKEVKTLADNGSRQGRDRDHDAPTIRLGPLFDDLEPTVLPCLPGGGQPSGGAPECFAIGIQLIEQGQYGQAIEAFSTAVDLDPTYASAYFQRGQCYQHLHDYHHALENYSLAIRVQPNLPEPYFARGFVYAMLGDLQSAVEDYNKCLQLDPENAVALNHRGFAYWRLGYVDRALADYDHAILLQPLYAEPWLNRGSARRTLRKCELAVEDLTRAITLAAEDPRVHYERGAAHHCLGNFDAAVQDYSRAIELDGEMRPAYVNRSVALLNQGKYEKALQDVNIAIALDETAADGWNIRGYIFQNLGREYFSKALDDYAAAIQRDPKWPEAYFNRGSLLYLLGAYTQSIQDLTKAIELDPKYALAYRERARAYMAIEKKPLAAADLEKYLELSGNGDDTYQVYQWLEQLR